MRLDQFLVKKGLFASRNKAQEAIKKGLVKVDNKTITKPSLEVENPNIKLLQESFYVSRAALKLKGFLKEFPIDLTNKECLDVGASTGGFSQILLEYPIKSLTCIDVGTNQLHESIKNNSKVSFFENQDIRDFKPNKTFDIIVCDVSFISLSKIIDAINTLTREKGIIILLFKPQFEVGKNTKRNKKGVIQDKKAIELAKKNLLAQTTTLNWRLLKETPSKVAGKEGNQEIFLCFQKDKK